LPIVVALVVVALALAVVKPWDGRSADPAAPEPSVADASPGPAASEGAPSDEPPAARDRQAQPDDAWLLGAVSPRDTWGVVAIADAAPGAATSVAPATAVEHWTATVPGPASDTPTAASAATGTPRAPAGIRSTTPVRLLGVSAPLGRTPLAIRVWRARGDVWRRVAAAPPIADHPAAHRLLRPATGTGVAPLAWPAGRYRLDLLLGGEVVTMEVRLDAPDVGSDMLSFAGPRPAPGLFAAPLDDEPPADVSALGDGPVAYAVAAGRLVPLEARATTPLDPATAWLDPARVVGTIDARGVRTLGVALPPDATEVTGKVRRLAPGPFAAEAAMDLVLAADGSQGDRAFRPAVEARSPTGLAWPAGTYAIDVGWTAGGEASAATWHIDLHPGFEAAPSMPLLTARGMAAQHARPGLLVPRPERLGMEAGSDALAWFPLGAAIDCVTGRIDEPPAGVGVVLGPDQVVLEAIGRRTRSGGGTAPVGLRIAPIEPGLTLLLPRDTPRFRAGIHELTLSVGPASDALGSGAPGTTSIETSICLGTPPFDR
jgi:hypothetical protein